MISSYVKQAFQASILLNRFTARQVLAEYTDARIRKECCEWHDVGPTIGKEVSNEKNSDHTCNNLVDRMCNCSYCSLWCL